MIYHMVALQATPEASLEDFDPVEIYIAIVDFVAVEESNISLTGGQCVQVGTRRGVVT